MNPPQIPGLIIGSQVGSGGQASVYKAENAAGTMVAVKAVARSSLTIDEEGRFKRESRLMERLDNKGIVPILQRGNTQTHLYYLMPLADRSLEDIAQAAQGGMATMDVIEHITHVAEAVRYLHSEGILHRDLKPANVLQYGADLKISDFGYGRDIFGESSALPNSAYGFGTGGYVAPEQWQKGHEADHRSDVYSLGQMAWRLSTGVWPHPNQDLDLLPEELKHIVYTATHPDPVRRYQSAVDFLRAISLVAAPDEWLEPNEERIRSLMASVAAGTLGAVASLLDALLSARADEDVFLRQLASAPADVVKQLASSGDHRFVETMRVFDGYASQGHPFSLTDTLADFMYLVVQNCAELEVNDLAMRRTIEMASSHNRWHVGRRFAEMLTLNLARSPSLKDLAIAVVESSGPYLAIARPYLVDEKRLFAVRAVGVV